MSTAVELAPLVGIVLACLSLGVSRATYYRLHRARRWPIHACHVRRRHWP